MAKPAPTFQKLRGRYYTPKPIAQFLARWAVQSPTDHVLEPSCGDGVVLCSGLETLIEKGASKDAAIKLVHGVEIDREERYQALSKLEAIAGHVDPSTIRAADFFAYCQSHLNDKRLFDAVIGNPPFIRYQNFLEEHRTPAFELMRRAGMRPNKLTNAWVPFLVASSFLLNPHGRLAMVIPAELLQVNYAAELRMFLSNHYQKLTIITFRKLIFEGIQQEVVLLLAEKNGGGRTGIRTVELENVADLASYEHTEFLKSEVKPMDHSKEKWTQYFLSKREIDLLRAVRKHPLLKRAGDVIDVDVGVVTGFNDFFVLSEEEVKQDGIDPYHTQRIVARSGHLKGILFTERDWQSNVENKFPAYLLDLPNVPFEELPAKAKAYVKQGEAARVNHGFKCRIRQRWYIVPSLWAPAAFMLRQIHAYPKLILNSAGATSTDTIHRVKLTNGVKPRIAASAFLNSLTFAFAEVIGRSYGGGVLELEPNEAEALPLPLIGAEKLSFLTLHHMLMRDEIGAVLKITDDVLLRQGLGLSRTEISGLRTIWDKLRDRRINRKHAKKDKTSSRTLL